MAKLSESAMQAEMRTLPGWTLSEGALVKQWTFADFIAAICFVDEVAVAAEAANHHPDIDIRYNVVRLALRSHDEGGVTERDAALAHAIEILPAGA